MSNVYKYEEQTLTRSEWERHRNENAKKLRKGNVIVTESSPRKKFK